MERERTEHRVESKKMGDKVGKWVRREKERSDNVENKEEMQKRKREMLGRDSGGGEMEERGVFKKVR